ncbi:MAG: YhcH/YjgK/YiaL family protein [Oscillospiraceae bacterium]|nr:YhcH/YjgK/YiaL family protein [Oscillospiraceae bacterium]
MIMCPWKDLLRYAPVLPGLEEAYEKVNALTSYEAVTYPLSDGNRFFVAVGTTKAPDLAEAHRQYLDIQYIVKGQEVMGWADLAACKLEGEFNETKDVGKYSGDFQYITIPEGYCYVAFPEDAHMPGRHLEVPNDFVKVVVKLKV